MRLIVRGVVSGVLEGRFVLLIGPPASGKTMIVEAMWALLSHPALWPVGIRDAILEIGDVTLGWRGDSGADEAGVRYVVVSEAEGVNYYAAGCTGAADLLPSNIGRVISRVEVAGSHCSYTSAWLRVLSIAVQALRAARGRAKLLVVDGLGRLPWAKRAETALILTALRSGIEVFATIDDPLQARIIARHSDVKPRIYVVERGEITEADDRKLDDLVLRL